jgi:phosphatidylglycerophosphate synthase
MSRRLAIDPETHEQFPASALANDARDATLSVEASMTLAGIRGPFITIPNLISLARIPLAVAAVVCLAYGYRVSAQLLMVASFATDALDGMVARWLKSTSEWGRILDPMADKMVFAVLGFTFAWLGLIPWWLVAVIFGRDALVAIGALLHMGRIGDVPSSNLLGKASTFLLAVYMFRQAFWPARAQWLGVDWMGWIAVALLLVSTIGYVVVYLRGLRDGDEGSDPASS